MINMFEDAYATFPATMPKELKDVDVYRMIIKAFESQFPRKVVDDVSPLSNMRRSVCCPICGYIFGEYIKGSPKTLIRDEIKLPNYCACCGQKVCWPGE